jgi:hypothetical protein
LDTRDTPFGPARRPTHARRPGEPRIPPPSAQNHHGEQPASGRSGGAEGNERLTALTGTVLLLLLAAEGVTLLQLGRLLTLHFFIGMLLLGPVALKAGSTIYRFVRYYTGSAPYRRKGPPAPLLRLLGPIVIASTAGVFGSGIMLAVTGPAGRQTWLFLHKGSFVIWFCAMTVHVLTYLPRLPRLLSAEFRGAATPEVRGGEYARQRYPGEGYPGVGQGYPSQGYPDQRYPGQGYPDQRYPDQRYPGQRDPGQTWQGHPGQYTGRVATVLGGRGVRLSLLAASLLAGLVIAMLTVHLAAPWHLAVGFHH